MTKKNYRKCAWCGVITKCKYRKGAKRFCSPECKQKYYDNDVPTLKRDIQVEFNKMITEGQSCSVCGQKFGKMDCSHILSRGAHDNLRFDIFNALPMCSRCHRWNFHDDPLIGRDWFKQNYKDRFDYLMFAKNQFKKWTPDELHKIRKAIKDKDFGVLLRFGDEYERYLAEQKR